MKERLDALENKFTEFYVKEVNDKFTEIDTKFKAIEKITEKMIFKCKECEFSSKSEKGLNTHKKRMHNPVQSDSIPYPKKCEVCEKEINNNQEMQRHLKTHSYKRA